MKQKPTYTLDHDRKAGDWVVRKHKRWSSQGDSTHSQVVCNRRFKSDALVWCKEHNIEITN